MTTLAPFVLIGSSSFKQVIRKTIKARMGRKFYQIKLRTADTAALEHLEKSPLNYNGRNVMTTPMNLVPVFLDGSFVFLQLTRTTINA